MRNLLFSLYLIAQSITIALSSGGHTSYTIHTTLRGKKYTLSNVSTVKEVQQSLLEQAGECLDPNNANIILLFGGQKLKSNDILEDIGVEDGSVMNAIPSSSSSKKKKKKTSTSKQPNSNNDESSNKEGGGGGMLPNMEELMKQSGLDPNLMNNLLSGSGGLGGDGATQPNLEQSMKMMQEMMSTPYFQEFLNNPDKMEESRQLLLSNPMMKSMIDSIPFMKDIIGDKDKFRDTMLSAAQMYQDEDGMADAMQRMNSMFGDTGMPGLDMMNDMINKNDNLALDELSEGDDDDD